jgi:hypothetical protein
MVIRNTGVFFQSSIYSRTVATSFYVKRLGTTPYKLFLKVPLVNKQLASSDFTFRRREKADDVKYVKSGAGRTSLHLFPKPDIGKRGGDGFLGAGLAKNKFCTNMLGLLSPNTTINLC